MSQSDPTQTQSTQTQLRTEPRHSADEATDATDADYGFRWALLLGVTGFAVGTATGATVMYLLDPDRGRRRRAMAKDQLTRATGEVASSLKATASDLGNRSKGWVHEASRKVRPADEVDDATLKARVRSTLGHCVDHPHSVVVSCDGGKVTLAGPVLASETDELIASVGRVPGVRSVRDLMERHESADGVPALQAEKPTEAESKPREADVVTH